MKIIDFARKGNVVRFYLGADDLQDWYGDDWDDCPYEHNAGPVYNRFVSGYRDVCYGYAVSVLEPSDGVSNSQWCKDDMKARKVPCIIIVPPTVLEKSWSLDSFAEFVNCDGVQRIYFGDPMEPEVVGLPPEMGGE